MKKRLAEGGLRFPRVAVGGDMRSSTSARASPFPLVLSLFDFFNIFFYFCWNKYIIFE